MHISIYWFCTNMQAVFNSVGLFFDIIGAILVATEVVNQFKGNKYRDNLTIDEMDKPARETKQYKIWERCKYQRMKWGLIFLVFGFILQIFSNWI